MKIGSLNNANAADAITGERKAATAPRTSAGAKGTEASAQVQLSSTASLLTQGATDPTFDTAKVDRIAQAIRDGRFQVNAEAIADKLISNAQELLGSASGH